MVDARTKKWLWAAVAAVPLFAGASMPAWAQFPVNNNGRARDANNQVGSGGNNDYGGNQRPSVTANQIANGNVTGGKAFRGADFGDARAFRGATAGRSSDRFIRDSAGTPTRTEPDINSFTAQPFYGESRAVAPPTGFAPLGFTGGYVAAQPGVTYNGQFRDAWLGDKYGANNTGEGITPKLGTSLLPGPQDDSNRQSVLTLSPLGGIRLLTPTEANAFYLSRLDSSRGDNPDRFRTDIDRLRSELENTVVKSPQATDANGRPTGAPTNGPKVAPNGDAQPGQQPQPLDKPLTDPLVAPANQQGSQQPNGLSSALSADPLGSSLNTQESLRRRLTTPVAQSTQYDEMSKRFKKYQEDQAITDEQAQAQFRQDVAQRNAATARTATGAAGAPGGNAGGAPSRTGAPGVGVNPAIVPSSRGPGSTGTGRVATPPTTIPAKPETPFQVNSLATGLKSKGLGEVLKSAEDLMRQGKFTSALDRYEIAEQVAPNNSLVALGRANAELGASSYRSAEAALRQAFTTDPALLHARYDLKGMIGQQRLQLLVTDLRDLARQDPHEAMPVFLLAYISYNTGAEAQAATYLSEVDRRLGKPDAVTKLLREHWALPAAGAPLPDGTK